MFYKMILYHEVVLKLVLSAFIGGLVGMEREVSNRPAGLRTHVLVSLGACLIMLISIDGFHGSGPFYRSDPARLAAQVVSGIGFLGAGTILRTGNTIKGLTTAASLWVCAGIGLAIGSGYYIGGLTTAAIALFALKGLSGIEKKFFRKKDKVLVVQSYERNGLIGDIGHVLGSFSVTIKDIKIVRDVEDVIIENIQGDQREIIEIQFSVKLPKGLHPTAFFKDIKGIKSVIRCFWLDEFDTFA